MLQFGVIRLPQRIAMLKGHKERARWANLLGDHAQELDHDGGDPAPFERGGDQTHGLVAGGSDGDEEGEVDLVLNKDLRGLGGCVFDEPPGGGDGAHAGQVAGGHGADPALGFEFADAP